jgi:DNA-binding transcriptional MocR family regulator
MASSLGVLRSTVVVAYERLAGGGLVGRRIGAGTFVAEQVVPARREATKGRADGVLRPRRLWESISLSSPSPCFQPCAPRCYPLSTLVGRIVVGVQ